MAEPTKEQIAAELETVKAELVAAKKDNDTKAKELAEAEKLIAELSDKLTQEEAKSPETYVTVNKQKYKVAVPKFNFEGEIRTAADVAKSKELQAKLLEIGSSVLQPV